MVVYTLQLARWRKAKTLDITVLDTTVKSGDPVFSPTWEMVSDIKANRITPEQYTEYYRARMHASFKANTERWREVIRGEPVAIACYCPAGTFCHRHLLVDIFAEICHHAKISFGYKGEIE